MKHSYDRSKKILTITFKHKKLIGYDIKGFPIHQEVIRTQTFMGLNKQDCIFRAKQYVNGDIISKPHYCKYKTLYVK